MLGSQLSGGEVIELRSDLGGGKTTFVTGLVRGTGSQDRVSSPTFTLNRIYKAKKFDIYHYDFYRLSEPGILEEQLAEAQTHKHVVVVEWAGIVKQTLANNRILIEFQPVAQNPDVRQITFRYPDSKRAIITYLETKFSELKP